MASVHFLNSLSSLRSFVHCFHIPKADFHYWFDLEQGTFQDIGFFTGLTNACQSLHRSWSFAWAYCRPIWQMYGWFRKTVTNQKQKSDEVKDSVLMLLPSISPVRHALWTWLSWNHNSIFTGSPCFKFLISSCRVCRWKKSQCSKTPRSLFSVWFLF